MKMICAEIIDQQKQIRKLKNEVLSNHQILMKKIRRRIVDFIWKHASEEQILAIEEFLAIDKRFKQ
jgi:hypothetical protein